MAQKRAVKGKRSLEILMRRLARSLARFVDGKTQSSSFFQMEDVVGGGARNYSANRNRQGSGSGRIVPRNKAKLVTILMLEVVDLLVS